MGIEPSLECLIWPSFGQPKAEVTNRKFQRPFSDGSYIAEAVSSQSRLLGYLSVSDLRCRLVRSATIKVVIPAWLEGRIRKVRIAAVCGNSVAEAHGVHRLSR